MKLKLKSLLQTMLFGKAELDNFLSLVYIVVAAVVVFGPAPGQGAATCPVSFSCRTCDPTLTYCTSCNAYYTLNNGTCTPCGTNCIQCTYGVSCDLCETGYGPDPTNSSNCTACTPTFCSNCPSDANTCTVCNAGYGQISGSQNCGPCSPNCTAGCNIQGAGKCDRCDAGYGYTATNSCAPCSANCSAGCAKAGDGKCDRCDPGFGFTATNSCAPVETSTKSVAGPVTSTPPAVAGNHERDLKLGLAIGLSIGLVLIILLAVLIALLVIRRKRLMKIEGAEGKPQSSVQDSNSRTQINLTMRSYEQLDDTSSERYYAYMNAKVSDADSERHYSYMNAKVSDADSERHYSYMNKKVADADSDTVVNHNPNRNTLYA